MREIMIAFLSTIVFCVVTGASYSEAVSGRYRVLPGGPEEAPPFDVVSVTLGPSESIGNKACRWWQIEVFKTEADTTPLFKLRALTVGRDPFDRSNKAMVFKRYILKIPATNDNLEYRNVHTHEAMLPFWKDFDRYFIPLRSLGSREQFGLPNTIEYLGHTLTLVKAEPSAEWKQWTDVKVLDLDPELLIGTGRSFKDKEGHRLPPGQDYTYVPITGDDYRLMIKTGFNLFTVGPDQEQYVRSEPVFYLRGTSNSWPLSFPADLYRSNYLGAVMFMDEPTMRLTGDKHIHNTLRYFSDFASVIRQRVHTRYYGTEHYGAYLLEHRLKAENKINLGDMRLMQHDYPSWETALETTFYQMAGGCNGLVHEGRYQLSEFQDGMDRWTGVKRTYTAEEYLRYEYALLRGGTRPFGKFWGTSIYGQADPALSPLAVTLAYDMGARYIWFWTSDHDHHLPWNEQLQLVKVLKSHAKTHPRPSIFGDQPTRDAVIVIPYGYFLSLQHGGSNIHANLWWVRELDTEGRNESSRRYRRVMERAHKAVIECYERGEDFDITVDDGRKIVGYKRVIRISDSE